MVVVMVVVVVVVAIAATRTSNGCYIRSSPRCVALKLDNPRWYKHLCFVNFRAPRSASPQNKCDRQSFPFRNV